MMTLAILLALQNPTPSAEPPSDEAYMEEIRRHGEGCKRDWDEGLRDMETLRRTGRLPSRPTYEETVPPRERRLARAVCSGFLIGINHYISNHLSLPTPVRRRRH